MNNIKHTIILKVPPSQRLVKRLALLTFSGVHSLLNNVSKVPDVMAQASHDVCEAWRETARPKA